MTFSTGSFFYLLHWKTICQILPIIPSTSTNVCTCCCRWARLNGTNICNCLCSPTARSRQHTAGKKRTREGRTSLTSSEKQEWTSNPFQRRANSPSRALRGSSQTPLTLLGAFCMSNQLHRRQQQPTGCRACLFTPSCPCSFSSTLFLLATLTACRQQIDASPATAGLSGYPLKGLILFLESCSPSSCHLLISHCMSV